MAFFVQEATLWKHRLEMKKAANKALHRTAIPLRSIAAGELGR